MGIGTRREKRRLSWRSFRGFALTPALALALVGCDEPRYGELTDADLTKGEDAGRRSDAAGEGGSAGARDAAGDAFAERDAQDAAETDARAGDGSRPLDDAASDAAVDLAWAAKLPGKYAVQSLVFSDDGSTVSRLKERLLAEIRETPDGYELILQACEQVLSSSLYTAKIKAPTKIPPRRHRLMLEANGFSSTSLVPQVGFDPEPPPDCQDKSGQLVMKRSFQTWISGAYCRCPGDPIPRADDCRVLDSDGDALPGYTLDVTLAQGLMRHDVYGVSVDHSRLVQGVVNGDGSLTARWEIQSSTMQFGCRPACLFNLSGPSPTCPPETSRLDFKRLVRSDGTPIEATCEAVLARAIDLFTEPEPSQPSRCGRP